MSEPTLADVLEAEHHEIDAGIHAFLGGADDGRDRLAAVFEELRRHIYLEEVYLFPPLTEAGLVALRSRPLGGETPSPARFLN